MIIQECFKNSYLNSTKFLSELINLNNIISNAIKDSSTASSDDHVTNTPASDVVTEAATEAATTPAAEIGEDTADALGELDNLADMGF